MAKPATYERAIIPSQFFIWAVVVLLVKYILCLAVHILMPTSYIM